MAVDQCYACVICDFMTFSHINLESHFKLRHDSIPPKSVFKPVFEPMCTVIAHTDELLRRSLLAAQNRQLAKGAEESSIAPRVKSETLDTMQSSSKVASGFTNDMSDVESKLYPVELSELPPVDKSYSAAFHTKSNPNMIKKEIIPELVPVLTKIDPVFSSHEDLEMDFARQKLLSVDDCLTRSTLKQGHLTLEIRNRNSPEIAKSWICWVCFRKFARCVGVERSLFLKHSKSFCPCSKNDLDDVPVDQMHVRLFCPRNCNFVTSDANAFCRHVYMCVKSEEHTESEHFMRIQSNFESCDNDCALPHVYERKLERSRSRGARKQTAVSIVVFDDPQSYELISTKLSSLTPEVARDLDLLSAWHTTLACQRLPVPKKPVIGQIEGQNLIKRMKQNKKSVVRAVGEKQTLNEPNLIHSEAASLGSQLMDIECSKQVIGCPDQIKLTSVRRRPRGKPVKD